MKRHISITTLHHKNVCTPETRGGMVKTVYRPSPHVSEKEKQRRAEEKKAKVKAEKAAKKAAEKAQRAAEKTAKKAEKAQRAAG